MILGGHEYYIDVEKYDKKHELNDGQEEVVTLSSYDELKTFIDKVVSSNENTKFAYSVALSEKNLPEGNDGYWEGIPIDFDHIEQSLEHFAMQYSNMLGNYDPFKPKFHDIDFDDYAAKLTFSTEYRGRTISFSRTFKDLIRLNDALRVYLTREFDQEVLKNGYHFSVDLVLSPGWFTGLEDVSFHHIEFEKNTVRLLTYDEITQSYFYAMTADFEIEDIEDLDDQWGDEIGLVEEEENRKKDMLRILRSKTEKEAYEAIAKNRRTISYEEMKKRLYANDSGLKNSYGIDGEVFRRKAWEPEKYIFLDKEMNDGKMYVQPSFDECDEIEKKYGPNFSFERWLYEPTDEDIKAEDWENLNNFTQELYENIRKSGTDRAVFEMWI